MRDIPIHTLAEALGEGICNPFLALHHLTGADSTSKVGTKLKALQRHPEHFFQILLTVEFDNLIHFVFQVTAI